jgi:hypothetical protein
VNKLAIIVGTVLVVSAARAQQFQYQFHDKPTDEANAIIVSHSLKQGSSSDSYLVGKVFNRGLKPARNVRIVYSVRNQPGVPLPANPAYLNPPGIAPTSFAD